MKVINRVWQSAMAEQGKVILSLVEKDKSCLFLDLGCFDGEFTQRLKTSIGTSQAFGLEIGENVVDLARERGIQVCRADLNELFPVKSETFNAVFGSQIIEHLHRSDTFIREIYRILKPGGYVIVSTPNLAAFHNIVCLVFGWQPPTAQVSDEVYVGNPFNPKKGRKLCRDCGAGHLRIFTKRALKELLEYHGFKVETIRGAGYCVVPAVMGNLLARLFPNYAVHLVAKARKISVIGGC